MKRWVVEMESGAVIYVDADTFEIDYGTLRFLNGRKVVRAFAADTWKSVNEVN